MPRMRTISECARLLREEDPGTAISQNAIRTMVLTGKIPHVSVGNKRLINYDLMLEMLHSLPKQETEQTECGVIRRVV